MISDVVSDKPISWETGYYDKEKYESEVVVYKSESLTDEKEFGGFTTTCDVRAVNEVAALILTETRTRGGKKLEYAMGQIATMIWKAKKEAGLGGDLGCVRLYYRGGARWKAAEIEAAWEKVTGLLLVALPVWGLEGDEVEFCGQAVCFDGGRAESDMWIEEKR